MRSKQQNLSSSPSHQTHRNYRKLFETIDDSYSSCSHRIHRNPESSNIEYLKSKNLQSRIIKINKRNPFYSLEDGSNRSADQSKIRRNNTDSYLKLPLIKPKKQAGESKSPYNKLNARRAYLQPTSNSILKEKMQKKGYGHKSICSVNCLKKHNDRKQKKPVQKKDDVPVIRQYLAQEAEANYPETQLNRYLSRMKTEQDERRSKLVYRTFFGIQPEFYKLETEYARQLEDETQAKSLIIEQKVRTEIPKIPSKEDLSEFIQSYEPFNRQIDMPKLLKSPRFLVQYSKNQLFFGEMVGNSKQGNGILIESGKVFQGAFRNNFKTRGLEINASGAYKGQFFNEKRNGDGEFEWLNGQYYIGEWKDGNRHGVGVWTNKHGDSYNGEWRMGKGEGYGVYIVGGQEYKGNFVDFKKDGWGKQRFINGDRYEGEFRKGLPEGKGRYTWQNGTKYEGEFITGLRNGKGKLKTPDGFIYKGEFQDEKPEGLCEIFMPNGDTYHGYLREGRKNGRGTLFLRDSQRVLDGYWQDDNFVRASSE